MNKLEDILNTIKQRSILSDQCFVDKNLDLILDKRDGKPFDQDWIASYKRIEAIWSDYEASDELIDLIEEIRKESFLAASRATSQHEIASYISDDFDLISKYIALSAEDSFVGNLLSIYMEDRIPKE